MLSIYNNNIGAEKILILFFSEIRTNKIFPVIALCVYDCNRKQKRGHSNERENKLKYLEAKNKIFVEAIFIFNLL